MKHTAVVLAVLVLVGASSKISYDLANNRTVRICESSNDVPLVINDVKYWCFTEDQLKMLIMQARNLRPGPST